MIKKIATVCLFLYLLSVGRIGFADQKNQHINHDTKVPHSSSEHDHRQDQNKIDIENDSGKAVGVEEKLGQIIPLDFPFKDEHNQSLILSINRRCCCRFIFIAPKRAAFCWQIWPHL